MPIGTSDGKQYADMMDYTLNSGQSFTPATTGRDVTDKRSPFDVEWDTAIQALNVGTFDAVGSNYPSIVPQ